MFEIRREYPYPVVTIGGDIDLTNISEFESTIEHAIRDAEKGLVLDLTGVAYFDSRTIHALFRYAQSCLRGRKFVMLVKPRFPSALHILELTGVGRLIPMLNTIPQALTALDQARLD